MGAVQRCRLLNVSGVGPRAARKRAEVLCESDQGVGKLNSKLLDASLAPKDTSPTLSCFLLGACV